jgi:hypothetical protein
MFRISDGDFELHRKVPYDYDSEFQDLYMKIAVAHMEGHIDVHEALLFQLETKKGLHTAPGGLFLRNYPGRLVLYPLEAAVHTQALTHTHTHTHTHIHTYTHTHTHTHSHTQTCCVVFFGGGWVGAYCS